MTIVAIGDGKSLDQGAAESFARILGERPNMLARVNSAYRSLAEQARLRKAWEVSHLVFALRPGVSKHNFGTALDIDSNPANDDHQWMVDNGREYGWIRTNPAEPWHFEYFPELDQHVSDTTTPEEIDMPTPAEVWGYKNTAVKNGTEDTYLILRKALWAAEDALKAVQALGTAAAPVIDYAKLAAAMPKPEPTDYAKLAKAVNDDAAQRMAQ